VSRVKMKQQQSSNEKIQSFLDVLYPTRVVMRSRPYCSCSSRYEQVHRRPCKPAVRREQWRNRAHVNLLSDPTGVLEHCSNADLRSFYNIFRIRRRNMYAIDGVRCSSACCKGV
jgi:hypothetical protein